MKLIYLGGALEVGASSILIQLNHKNILLDCGIRQKKTKDKLPEFSRISTLGGIDAIIVSHAHMDHIGSLPLISKEYPSAKIYMNRMTMELARVLLYDSLKIMNYQEGEIPVFNETDVLNMFERIELVPFQQETTILKDITLTLYMAGHIAGASCCYLKTKEGTLFYTGDFSLFPQHAISGLSIPKLRPDIVISEATYGDKLHANRESEENRLIDTVSQVIESNGKILIPVFALGRSQEVLLILKKAMNKKQLKKIPVYIDGMVRNINTVFQNNPLYLKESLGKRILRGTNIFYNDDFIKVESDADRKKIIESNTPCIIISSSGMLMGGMSEYYASALVNNPQNAIILTGYQDEESNGSQLLKLLDEPLEQRFLKLNDKVCPVHCSIHKIGLSAHADKQEIKSLFQLLHPKYIILGHGEESIIESFAKEVIKELHTRIYTPRVGELLELEIKNPRKQINHQLEHLYALADNMKNFSQFIQENYGTKLFTIEDLAYIYQGKTPTEEEIHNFTDLLLSTPYFTPDKRRYFLFRVTDELELQKLENKEITSQGLESIIQEKLKDFPYQKLSFYLNEKRIVVTFDFPRTIHTKFEDLAQEILEETGFTIEKNDNINNRACELAITNILGKENIDKISYLPLEDKFKIKVYSMNEPAIPQIKATIGYDAELILTAKKDQTLEDPISLTGDKLEQNIALTYIDQYFQDKPHRPYKKSLKNGKILLSFISYEIGQLYQEDFRQIEQDIHWEIELNHNANMNMIFTTLDTLLEKYQLIKQKNPSYLPITNTVNIKLETPNAPKVAQLQTDFKESTGLNLTIDN